MSLVLGTNHAVADFDSWLQRLDQHPASIARTAAHHVVIYRSMADPNDVFVTVGLRAYEPIDAYLRSPRLIEWFDAAGLDTIPPIFVGQTVEKLDLRETESEAGDPGVVVASIGRVDDIERMRHRVAEKIDGIRAAGVLRFWMYQALDDVGEVMLLQELDSERHARGWIRHRDAWAAFISGPGFGVYPSIFIGKLVRMITYPDGD